MCGGGTSTTQQTVQIPQAVLDRYNSVNQRAEGVSNTPFQIYSTDPSSFVAPLSSTQQAGIAGTNAGAGLAQPYYGAATGQLASAQNGVQPYYDAATQSFAGASGLAQPYLGGASADIDNAQAFGGAGASQALHSLQRAAQAAAPLQSAAASNISGGLSSAQPYNSAAGAAYAQGLGAAQPLNEAANQNITGAYSGAQPYQDLATGLGLAGARSVNPDDLGASQINKYLSPYLGTVLSSTSALLNQQNQQQQSGQLGNAIRSGAFGGDRAGIAAANLAQQQQLGNASILSGILNQGYGQALGAAQQQQGLGLSAEQANRAAQQAASGQLAAIGQQGFGQGLSTAQAQAALGQQQYGQFTGTGQAVQGLGNQIFGQGLGAGQAQASLGNQLYSQGANTAQQQAAIGQQLFGQGLSAAQQQAALGQQQFSMGAQTGQNLQGLGQAIYGTGANTAQQLAGLGAGAQGAALQGAQAQLAAGQQQQQTQQAGLTALYNQFLQQQSYPFQVSQFLANIAEGTGALSGSTTTTSQPAGFFSDKRLKEGVQPVGETYDGQKIVKFRYKGEPNWRMGLIAQDVEKAHPDAVGESHGFKTVDYGKATDAAARRGKFYRGGLAANDDAYAEGGLASNYDPELTRELLANANGMYGPYLATGTSGPYGGMARVPSANLPMHQLALPGAPPAARSGLASAKQIADLGTEFSKDADSAKDAWAWLDRKIDPKTPPFDPQGPSYARGGLAGYADGGMPYGADGLDIPDDKPDLKLQTPGTPPGQPKSGLSDIADLAKIVADVAAMNRGGAVDRRGFDDGGGVSDLVDELNRRNTALSAEAPDFNPRSFYKDFTLPHEGGLNPHDLNGSPTFMGFNQKANPDIDVTKLTPETAADRFTTNYFAPSGAGKLPPQLAAEMGDTAFMNPAKARQFLAQSGGDPDKFMAAREAWQAHMAATDPADAKYGPAWAKRSRDLRAYAGKFASGLGTSASATPDVAAPPPAAGLGGPGNVPQAAPAQASDSAADAPAKAPWYSHLLDREYLVPALDFLGAMGTAPTRNFGAALAYGAKGAALGLQGQQELAIKRAVAQADILGKTMGVAGSRFVPLGGGQWRDNAQGDIISGDERLRRIQGMPGIGSLVSPKAKAATAPAAAPAGPAAPAAATSPPSQSPTAPEPAPPQTATEAIYAKYDNNPRVADLRSKADTFAKQADDFLGQANDPYVKGTPQAEQLLQAANNAREQAHQYIQQWQQLREQLATPDIATQTEGQKKRLELQVQAKQDAYDRATQAQNTLQQTRAIISNLRDPNTGKYNVNGGPGGEALAKAGGVMTQFGLSPELAKMLTGTNPMDAAAIEKLRTTLGTEIGRQELAGSQVRVSEWNQFLKTTPGVDLPGAASEWILKNIIEPRAQQSVGLYKDVRKMDPLKDDIQGATFDFQEKNPWWHPSAGAVSGNAGPTIGRNAQGVLAPTSPADMKGQKSGTPFIIPSGPNKGKTGYWHE